MAKLRFQVFVLAVCLFGVVMAQHYVGKLAEQAAAIGTGHQADDAATGAGGVQVP